nr:hypothetical protein Iba_scaffold8840CG0110 [Ipomoea batatas]
MKSMTCRSSIMLPLGFLTTNAMGTSPASSSGYLSNLAHFIASLEGQGDDNITPFTCPVVPDEYKIAAKSDWLTSTSTRLSSQSELFVIDSNSGESISTVPYRSFGSLCRVADVAKAITGLESSIWREISVSVLIGLAGEMTTPMDSSEK